MTIVRSSDERIERSLLVSTRRNYVLLLLALVYTFNYVDRQILIILAEPLRMEFGLKDWQLGFLTGTAFALFYATLGIPIARLADRGNRVNIIVAALTIWSAMTALCGAVNGFFQLAVARVGVGVGEAGGSPPAIWLLSSYFSTQHRSTAIAVYSIGATVGILLGFVIGGLVNQHYGWRAAFLTAGVPGLLLAGLLSGR
jgi:MFS family permease